VLSLALKILLLICKLSYPFCRLFVFVKVVVMLATNLHIGEQKVRQAFQIGKIGEPLFRFFLRIYNYHIKLQIIKLLVMIYMPCHLLMHGV